MYCLTTGVMLAKLPLCDLLQILSLEHCAGESQVTPISAHRGENNIPKMPLDERGWMSFIRMRESLVPETLSCYQTKYRSQHLTHSKANLLMLGMASLVA